MSLPLTSSGRLLNSMTKKLLLWVGVLALSTVAIVSAKSYELVFSGPTKAGSVQLAAGTYKLEVEGSNAIFTDKKTRQSVTVPVKVENGGTKYSTTALDTMAEGGATQITAIKLGGTTTKLGFSQ